MGEAQNRGEGFQGDVALFIDWENIKEASLKTFERMPDPIVLKKAATRFGRLALARAYANWQDERHKGDCEILYWQGIDPIFVHTRVDLSSGEVVKNSGDVRLAIDCTEQLLAYRAIGTVVLVTGDGDFVHLVNLVKATGRQVVVIAGSDGLRSEMTYLADHFLLYENLVTGLAPAEGKWGEENEKIRRALAVLTEAVGGIRVAKKDNTFAAVKTQMRKILPGFEEETLGFPQFEYFVFRAEAEGLVRVSNRRRPWRVYLGDEAKDDEGLPLFGRHEWHGLITLFREMSGTAPEERAKLSPSALREKIVERKLLKDLPGVKVDDFIQAAKESDLLLPMREPRYAKEEEKWYSFYGLRLNEYNSRVQVYLALSTRKTP